MNTSKKAIKKQMATGRKLLPVVFAVCGVLLLAALLKWANTGDPLEYTMFNSESISYEKGKVTAVLSEQLEPAESLPGWELGSQTITVQLTSGAQKGKDIRLENNLSTTHNIQVKPGQRVIVKADRPQGVAPYYSLYNYDRTPGLLAVAGIFIVFMVLAGRFKGVRSVLGLGVSLLMFFGFLIPSIYRGYSPAVMSVITVIMIAAFSLLLLNGFCRKSYTALAAVVIGVLFSTLFFLLISKLMPVFGYNIDEAEELIIVSQNTGLKIGEVLFAGVLVSSLGAVLDTTTSIAATLYEMKELQPGLTGGALFRSGMAVGRDMIGTMCQTLILAFVGSSLATLLALIAYGTRLEQFLSSDYMAIEVVHGITGSLSVVVAVPLTAALCVFLGRKAQRTALADRTASGGKRQQRQAGKAYARGLGFDIDV